MEEILSAHPKTAERLLGCELKRTLADGTVLRGKIVETEYYDQQDAASHSFSGKTMRNDVMFGPAKHAYVYFTYGMHYCFNVVVGGTGIGAAILIRAIEPVLGLDHMARKRGKSIESVELTNGPAKLCQALSIDKNLNGHNLNHAPLELVIHKSLPKQPIVATKRIGISKNKDAHLRFYLENNPYVSVNNVS